MILTGKGRLVAGLLCAVLWPAQGSAQQLSLRHDPVEPISHNTLAGLNRAPGRYVDFEPVHDPAPPAPKVFHAGDGVKPLTPLYKAPVHVPEDQGPVDKIIAAAAAAASPLIQSGFIPPSLNITSVDNKLYASVIRHENWEFGPLAIYHPGPKDVDETAIDRMNGKGLPVEFGLFLGYASQFEDDPLQQMKIHLNVTQDSRNSGQIFSGVSVRYSW